ncbi:MAG: formylmethanofuran dehydrogenase subunit A [Planctomycetota bacterium]
MLTCLKQGTIVDPANTSRGHQSSRTGDLWFRGDRIIEPPDGPADVEFDVTDCIVMAGGIDLHTHIGGGKVTLARMLLGDQMPPWSGAKPANAIDPSQSEFLPSAGATAERYLNMGYTTCFEPAVIPCNARSAHAEMADVRGIDTGGYCLLGNDPVLLSLIADGAEQSIINAYVAWMVTATRCIAVKVVNPGGIDAFKYNVRHFDVNSRHPKYDITPCQIIRILCRAVHEIGLRHPLHVHCSNLGMPGNIASTLATIEAADGYPIHLTHVQFHCYGADGPHGISSATLQLVKAMERHPNVTVDVGQIQFGRTVTISADTMHQYANARLAKPRKSILVDIECEAGCGVIPFRYQNREFVHCLQWAIGLELFLMIDDPSRVFLTTDHPNGAPFTSYPHLLRLLGDRSFRETALAEIDPDAAAATQLSGMNRTYDFTEMATMTRWAPAKILGLDDRGHLSPGALADVVVYQRDDDIETMFAEPSLVFKHGQMTRKDGARISDPEASPDRTLRADPPIDASLMPMLIERHRQHACFQMENLWIDDEEWHHVIAPRSARTATP